MKKTFFIVIFFIIISCGKKKEDSYIINNHEYIIKTDSVQELLIYKDTLKFYYLKGKLVSVIINNFITPEYDTVKDDPFFDKTIYCINENNEFDAAIKDYYGTNTLASFVDDYEYVFKDNIWQNNGRIRSFFYDFEAMNLDIALARNNYYNFPEFIKKTPKDSLTLLSIDQDKEIDFYDVKSLKKLKKQSNKSFVFKYLKDIKIINNSNEKLILAKIIEEENGNEYYINLKDIISDIRIGT